MFPGFPPKSAFLGYDATSGWTTLSRIYLTLSFDVHHIIQTHLYIKQLNNQPQNSTEYRMYDRKMRTMFTKSETVFVFVFVK